MALQAQYVLDTFGKFPGTVPTLFILNYLVLMPVFARDILKIGAPGLGLLNASLGVGALSGALLVAILVAVFKVKSYAKHLTAKVWMLCPQTGP